MKNLVDVLMERHGCTEFEAQAEICKSRTVFGNRLKEGENPFVICGDLFGLNPIFIMDII